MLAGAGNTPIAQHGAMYLTEPLHDGDVIGFSFVVPAKAGPIDFGKVVTTSGVRLDKGGDTATTDAAEIPQIVQGHTGADPQDRRQHHQRQVPDQPERL